MPEKIPAVGLDAQLWSPEESYRAAGVSHYIDRLLAHLPAASSALRFVAYLPPGAPQHDGWLSREALFDTHKPWKRILWEQTCQRWACRHDKLSLLHAPVNVGPLLSRIPQVITVHDLSFFRFPHLFKPAKRAYLQRFTRWSTANARRIITVSNSAREDVIQVLGVAPERVVTVYNGVDALMRPAADKELDEFRRRVGLAGPIILFVGTIEPRKNIDLILQAFAHVRSHGFPHRLVIAGGMGWYYDEVFRSLERLKLGDSVDFPGYVPQADLPLWYSAADLFVYPSLYEGFGFPPLEAMACGTPVIVSNVSSLPEVVGTAGSIVSPNDANALASEIERLLTDDQLHEQRRLAGLARSRSFTWERTAAETFAVYLQALGASA